MNARDRKKKREQKSQFIVTWHINLSHSSNFLVDKSVLFLPFHGTKKFTTTFRNVCKLFKIIQISKDHFLGPSRKIFKIFISYALYDQKFSL